MIERDHKPGEFNDSVNMKQKNWELLEIRSINRWEEWGLHKLDCGKNRGISEATLEGFGENR